VKKKYTHVPHDGPSDEGGSPRRSQTKAGWNLELGILELFITVPGLTVGPINEKFSWRI
jgi:hypothetical protein